MTDRAEVGPLLARILDEAHAKQLPALIAEWVEAEAERRWIARALRIDLALLTERPELAVPCLYRRCAFVGDGDAERGIYQERAAPPVDLAALRDTVRAWSVHAPRPWLRALRPPSVPLDGAVVEEYRTAVKGALWVSGDGERIGVDGGDAYVAWERATGRRIDGARARRVVPAAPAAWNVAFRENTWGRMVIERGDARIELAIGSGEIIRSARTLTDDLVIVLGDDIDEDDFYGLVDTAAARIRWRASGRVTSLARIDDDRVLVGHRTGIDTIDLATGAARARWRCPFVGEVVPLPDGNVATRVGAVIRVWDVAEAAARPQVVHASTNSWTPAAFSPDGKRLVTGQLLCDAETGAFVAYLDCNGPEGWLEGGPPPGCQRLCNDVFVEIMPFGLTLWDTRNGRQVLHDRERRARFADCVAFDPTGTSHAVWSERGSLQLYRVRQGTLLVELRQALPEGRRDRRLGFTPDGARLVFEDAGGERWAVPVASGHELEPLAADAEPWEPPTTRLTVDDGLLVLGDAAIPYDDDTALVSPDGRAVAWLHGHYQIVPP